MPIATIKIKIAPPEAVEKKRQIHWLLSICPGANNAIKQWNTKKKVKEKGKGKLKNISFIHRKMQQTPLISFASCRR